MELRERDNLKIGLSFSCFVDNGKPGSSSITRMMATIVRVMMVLLMTMMMSLVMVDSDIVIVGSGGGGGCRRCIGHK